MAISKKHIPRIQAYLARGINTASGLRDAFARDGYALSLQTCYDGLKAARAASPLDGAATPQNVTAFSRGVQSALALSEIFAGHTQAALDQLAAIAGDSEIDGAVRQKAATARAEISILAQSALREGLLGDYK